MNNKYSFATIQFNKQTRNSNFASKTEKKEKIKYLNCVQYNMFYSRYLLF